MKQILIFLITVYQKTLSLDHGWFRHLHQGGYCRYQPTCSEYAKQSINEHGAIKGIFLSVARVGRCHPWAPVGFDPILNKQIN